MSEKQELLKTLSEGESFENVKAELDRIYKKESIMNHLAGSFPAFTDGISACISAVI